MPRPYDEPDFTLFGDAPSPLNPLPYRPAEIDPTARKFGPEIAPPDDGASSLQLGFFAAFNFVLVFAACLGIWAVMITGGFANLDLGAIGREILGAIKLSLSHLSPPTPALPPTA